MSTMRQSTGDMSLDGVSEYGGWFLIGPVLHVSASGSYGPPRAVSVFKLGLQVVRFCFFYAVKILKKWIKTWIWIFRELDVLVNNLVKGRNLDTISNCMINHELDQVNLQFRLSFLRIKQFMFLCSNNAIEDTNAPQAWTGFLFGVRNSNIWSFLYSFAIISLAIKLILYTAYRSTQEVRSSLYL